MNDQFSSRYQVPTHEDYEPNSNQHVLKNYLSITSKEKIEEIEAQELNRVENTLIQQFSQQHQFTANDLCAIHENWLGNIYPSAGRYRNVNLAKENFQFATAHLIPNLMVKFETDILAKHTPCLFENIEKIALSLATVHVEFILIHPFREGNGRTARLLALLMALQADLPPLNFTFISPVKNKVNYDRYISAIHQGLDINYQPMTAIFKAIVEDST